jgi:C1A family cysteine protease
LSHQEFRDQFLGSKKPNSPSKAEVAQVINNPVSGGAVDWTGVYTTPVKNQAQCGSCWAFSATEQIESDSMRTLGTNYVLSPQQIVSCDHTAFGCGGGWTEHAYNYVSRTGGLETDADYPYTSATGNSGTCKSNSDDYKVTVTKYYTVQGENQMAQYMQSTGPLSVCLDASSWQTYRSGILPASQCGNSVDHCVQAVGVDTSSNGYWKVRNSWGTSWGEKGFIRLQYGTNTCDITNDPTYVAVKKV